jgi:phage-related protein
LISSFLDLLGRAFGNLSSISFEGKKADYTHALHADEFHAATGQIEADQCKLLMPNATKVPGNISRKAKLVGLGGYSRIVICITQ